MEEIHNVEVDVLNEDVLVVVGLELQKVFWRMKKWLHSYFKGLFCPFFNDLK
jgi:hypothetical protein